MGSVDRRGEAVALLGMLLSLVGAVVLAILAVATGSTSGATWASAFLVFGSAGVWLLTLIQLHQRRLVAEETLEVAELERQRREKLGGAQTIGLHAAQYHGADGHREAKIATSHGAGRARRRRIEPADGAGVQATRRGLQVGNE